MKAQFPVQPVGHKERARIGYSQKFYCIDECFIQKLKNQRIIPIVNSSFQAIRTTANNGANYKLSTSVICNRLNKLVLSYQEWNLNRAFKTIKYTLFCSRISQVGTSREARIELGSYLQLKTIHNGTYRGLRLIKKLAHIIYPKVLIAKALGLTKIELFNAKKTGNSLPILIISSSITENIAKCYKKAGLNAIKQLHKISQSPKAMKPMNYNSYR